MEYLRDVSSTKKSSKFDYSLCIRDKSKLLLFLHKIFSLLRSFEAFKTVFSHNIQTKVPVILSHSW